MAKVTGLHAFFIKERYMKIMAEKGYRFYDTEQAYNVNVIAVRSDVRTVNKYDDMLLVIYRNPTRDWEILSYPITTDPSAFYANKANSKGTAVLIPDQYEDTYKIVDDRFVQVSDKSVEIYREANKESLDDEQASAISQGHFGIDIDGPDAEVKVVDRWCAGNQLFKRSTDYNEFIRACKRAAKKFGNCFTYTLLTEGDVYDSDY